MPFFLNRHPRTKRGFVLALLLLPCLIEPSRAIIAREADNRKWGDIRDSVSRRLLLLENRQDHAPADSADYITESIRRLKVIMSTIQRLVKSDQPYGIRYISGGMGYTYYDPREKMIIFHIDSVRVANFIHEATHGGQFEIGSIAYTKYDTLGFGDDCEDEAEAYRNEFAYDPSMISGLDSPVLVHSYSDITPEWVKRHPAYRFVPLNSINVKTDSGTLNKAYPWYQGKWRTRSKHPLKRPLKDDSFYLFRKVQIDTCLDAGKTRMGA